MWPPVGCGDTSTQGGNNWVTSLERITRVCLLPVFDIRPLTRQSRRPCNMQETGTFGGPLRPCLLGRSRGSNQKINFVEGMAGRISCSGT